MNRPFRFESEQELEQIMQEGRRSDDAYLQIRAAAAQGELAYRKIFEQAQVQEQRDLKSAECETQRLDEAYHKNLQQQYEDELGRERLDEIVKPLLEPADAVRPRLFCERHIFITPDKEFMDLNVMPNTDEYPGESWTNAFRDDGTFIASIERVYDVSGWLEWAADYSKSQLKKIGVGYHYIHEVRDEKV